MLIRRHLWILVLGLVAFAVGFILLAGRHLSLGPLLIFAGYCLALPAFIWRLFRSGVGE